MKVLDVMLKGEKGSKEEKENRAPFADTICKLRLCDVFDARTPLRAAHALIVQISLAPNRLQQIVKLLRTRAKQQKIASRLHTPASFNVRFSTVLDRRVLLLEAQIFVYA